MKTAHMSIVGSKSPLCGAKSNVFAHEVYDKNGYATCKKCIKILDEMEGKVRAGMKDSLIRRMKADLIMLRKQVKETT